MLVTQDKIHHWKKNALSNSCRLIDLPKSSVVWYLTARLVGQLVIIQPSVWEFAG